MIQRQHVARVSLVSVPVILLIGLLVMNTPRRTSSMESPAVTRTSLQPNIIFITVDALRSDHISSYGYTRTTTPNLDAWLTTAGVRFTNASANAGWTYPSNAAILTGRYPSTIGLIWDGDTHSHVPEIEKLLAESMHEVGYYTVGFNSAFYASRSLGFAQGFDIFQELIRGAPTRTFASEINALAFNWLDTTWATSISGTQPLFLYLYYFDPHTYYNSPPPYDTLFDNTYTGTVTANIYADGVAVSNGTLVLTPRDVEHVVALYDGDIAYWDYYLGQMLTHLNNLRLLDNSLIIVTSDHGQLFGEHRKWTHRNSLYEEALRVPLIMRYTGVISAGLIITTPVQSTDIVPTILDWLNEPIPDNLDGLSLKQIMQGQPISLTRTIFSELNSDRLFMGDPLPPQSPLRALKQDTWKLIHPIGQPWAEELYQVRPQSLYELDNLVQAQSTLTAQLRQILTDAYHVPFPRLRMPVMVK